MSTARHQPLRALRIIVVGLALATVGGVVVDAARLAMKTVGEPFPGLFVDPFGSFSDVALDHWHSDGLRLRFPERLVAVDDRPIAATSRYGDLPLHRLSTELRRVHALGLPSVTLRFEGHDWITRPLLTIGAREVGFFFVLYALVGLFLLWSGMLVLVIAGRRHGALAYAVWSLGGALFFVTFFDYHTTARLVPWFIGGSLVLQNGLVWLAYAFPEPPRRHRRLAASLAIAFSCASLAIASGLLGAPLHGVDARGLRMTASALAVATPAVLAASILWRLSRARGVARAELRSAAWGLVAIPLTLAVAALAALVAGRSILHVILPLLAPIIPLSIGFALVRHNILATTALLTRRMVIAPVVLAGGIVALIVWLRIYDVAARGGAAWLPSLVAAAMTVLAVVVIAQRAVERILFPAAASFRPTIEHLADELAVLDDVDAIHRTIVQVVRRWLPAERIEVLTPAALGTVARLPADGHARLAAGASVWTDESPLTRQLVVPVRSLGELRAVLVLAPKEQGALYNSEDMALLETVASLAAVALHKTAVLSELEAFRRLQVETTQGEKRLALGLLGAEISHEIAYPLNFFRFLLRQAGRSGRLEPEDLEIGREEVERLERMLAGLRRLEAPSPHLTAVAIAAPVERALSILREAIREQSIVVTVEIERDATVHADADALVQLVLNVLRNAVQAAGERGRVGVRFDRRAGVLDIWDDGPGIPEHLRQSIFNPWFTTKPGGTGLGLAVTQRIVRSLGWSIGVDRVGARTVVSIRCNGSATATPDSAAEGS